MRFAGGRHPSRRAIDALRTDARRGDERDPLGALRPQPRDRTVQKPTADAAPFVRRIDEKCPDARRGDGGGGKAEDFAILYMDPGLPKASEVVLVVLPRDTPWVAEHVLAHRSADLLQDADVIGDGQTGDQAVISGALMVFDLDTGDALLKAIRRTLASAASAETLASASRKTGQVLGPVVI